MAKFIIKGGNPLKGKIRVSGMKNAATPIIASTLLTDKECIINNVPDISDVNRLLDIIQGLGAKIKREGSRVSIKCAGVNLRSLDKAAVQAMRSSILLLGPLLARFSEVRIPLPGGCIIGNRPIDVHLEGLKGLGVSISKTNGDYFLSTKGLKGNEITLSEFSVTATENLIMASVLAKGRTVIKLAAAEPHVQDLCRFLNSIGAKIYGIGTHFLYIEGVNQLYGAEYTIIPDQIEAGTLAVAAAVTQGQVLIENTIPSHLDIVLYKLKEAGVNFEIGKDSLKIMPSPHLKAFKIKTMPYPGFPTDLQAPFSILAIQAKGTSLIHDPLYESRFRYIQELIKMGANAVVCDPHRVLITGPIPLYGQEIQSYDLRAGATLIIAGLAAQGQTIINEAEVVDRGYERIEERLSNLGANIQRVES